MGHNKKVNMKYKVTLGSMAVLSNLSAVSSYPTEIGSILSSGPRNSTGMSEKGNM